MESAYKVVLVNIFKNPLKAFSTIYAYDLYKYGLWLLALTGIAAGLNRKAFTLANTNHDLVLPMLSAIGFGAIGGWLGMAAISLIIYWAGTWLNGRATYRDIINVASYAALPCILMIITTPVFIILLRENGYVDANYPHVWGNVFYKISKVSFYFSCVLNLYYIGLLIIGISVAQGFSIVKGFLNFLLAAAILIVPLLLITSLVNI